MVEHTSKLLRFTPSVICHQQCPVILHQRLLQLILCILIHIFLVVSHDALSNSLTDGVYLGGVTAAVYADADIDIGEFIKTDDEEGFVDLERGRAHQSHGLEDE